MTLVMEATPVGTLEERCLVEIDQMMVDLSHQSIIETRKVLDQLLDLRLLISPDLTPPTN